MKFYIHLLLISLFLVGVISVMTNQVRAKEITVNVDNIDISRPGNIMVMLYGEDGVPKDHSKALTVSVLLAIKEKITVRFFSVPAEFAIKVLHDEDDTGKVTKNWTGFIPAEGLGFSNGAKLSFGPPNFVKAKMQLSDITNPITISIAYP